LTKDGNIKVGDLNVSKVNHAGLMFTQTGTPYYASPEVWKDKPYDSKSDLWSLGCVLYEMCNLKPPFTASDMKGLYNKVIKGKYQRIPKAYSNDLANVIDMCLQVTPANRPTAAQLLTKKEVVLHLRENGYEEEKSGNSVNLLDTIKLPSNFNFINDNLPSSNYNPIYETIQPEHNMKLRNLSASGRSAQYKNKLISKERSLSALKKFQQSPASSNTKLNISRVHNYKNQSNVPHRSNSNLPLKNNRAAYYRMNSDAPHHNLPPIADPAGMPSLKYLYSERSRGNREPPLPQSYQNGYGYSSDQSRGHKRKADIASRKRIQQRLISKAFGLPNTTIDRIVR
jgi:hypothetical protein